MLQLLEKINLLYQVKKKKKFKLEWNKVNQMLKINITPYTIEQDLIEKKNKMIKIIKKHFINSKIFALQSDESKAENEKNYTNQTCSILNEDLELNIVLLDIFSIESKTDSSMNNNWKKTISNFNGDKETKKVFTVDGANLTFAYLSESISIWCFVHIQDLNQESIIQNIEAKQIFINIKKLSTIINNNTDYISKLKEKKNIRIIRSFIVTRFSIFKKMIFDFIEFKDEYYKLDNNDDDELNNTLINLKDSYDFVIDIYNILNEFEEYCLLISKKSIVYYLGYYNDLFEYIDSLEDKMKTKNGETCLKIVKNDMSKRLNSWISPNKNAKNKEYQNLTRLILIKAYLLNPNYINKKLNKELIIISSSEFEFAKKELIKEFKDYLKDNNISFIQKENEKNIEGIIKNNKNKNFKKNFENDLEFFKNYLESTFNEEISAEEFWIKKKVPYNYIFDFVKNYFLIPSTTIKNESIFSLLNLTVTKENFLIGDEYVKNILLCKVNNFLLANK